MAESFEHREREVRRGYLMREVLANEPRQLRLMIERVYAGHDAAGAMSEQEDRQSRLTRFGERYHRRGIALPITHAVDEKPLAVRFSAAAQITRVDRESVRDQLFGRPSVFPAVRIQSVDNHDHAARGVLRPPPSNEDLQPTRTLKAFFTTAQSFCHGCPSMQKTEPAPAARELSSKVSRRYSSRTSPRRVATLMASVRLVTPSFSNRWPRCVLTVRSLMSSAVAISLLAFPSAISLSVAISRGVSCTRVTPSASFAAAAGAV